MKAQDKRLSDLFQHMLEKPEQLAPHLDSSALPAKEVEEMTACVDLADMLRGRSTSAFDAELALSRAKIRVLASVSPATPLAESPSPSAASRLVVRPAAAASAPWQGILDIFRAPAVPTWAAASVAALLILFVSIYMSVVFTANAMPGDVTYPFKRFVEQVSLVLTFDAVLKAERMEVHNQERLHEAQETVENREVVHVTFPGTVQGREGDFWIIGDIKVLVEQGGELLERLGIGATVYVEGIVSSDGVVLYGMISAPTPTPSIASTPLLDSLLPGINLESLPTDTPAPLPTKRPTLKPVRSVPVRPRPTQKPRPTAIQVATATPTTPIDVVLTPTVDIPLGTVTATPLIDETPEITSTPVETVDAPETPETTPPPATEIPAGTPIATTEPGETTEPVETEVAPPPPPDTPVPETSPTPAVPETPTAPTPTTSVEDTPTPLPDDTPTPLPVVDPPTPVPPTNTPVVSSTDTPVPLPTNTPVPLQPTITPVPQAPTNTPQPPAPPEPTPAP